MENKIEQPKATEKTPQQETGAKFELPQKPEKQSQTKTDDQATAPTPDISQIEQQVAPPEKSGTVKKIESILSEDLDEFYTQLDPQQQQEFKRKGEESANKINQLLQQAQVKIKEVIAVIRNWLASAPGLNKFFVEQSAKIKADKILFETGHHRDDIPKD